MIAVSSFAMKGDEDGEFEMGHLRSTLGYLAGSRMDARSFPTITLPLYPPASTASRQSASDNAPPGTYQRVSHRSER